MRRSPLRLPALGILVFLLLPAGAGAAATTPQEAIEERLMCYCGCSDLTVRVCTCGTAASIRREIVDRLGRGEDEETIVAAFISTHGEKILSAPTKQGFNLLAWFTPMVVILITAAALIVTIRRWESHGAADAAGGGRSGATGEFSPEDREVLKRIEREIRERH